MDKFKCRLAQSSYCKFYLRECAGVCCHQAYCAYCIHGSTPPDETKDCQDCDQLIWKKENYIK
jgi:hypothetical protein